MFSQQIKMLRKNHGLTQIEFAKQFSIATGTIAMWEIGKRQPDYDTLMKLADFFNVPTDYLLGAGIYGVLSNNLELKQIVAQNLEIVLGSDLLTRFNITSLTELDDVAFCRLAAALIDEIHVDSQTQEISLVYFM